MQVRWIPHLSPACALAVALRRDLLRKPVGLEFSEAQLAAEAGDFHLACFDGSDLVGCLLLSDRGSNGVQMRQVAVREDRQGKGLGYAIVGEPFVEVGLPHRAMEKVLG